MSAAPPEASTELRTSALLLPLAVVMAPQMTLAAVQHSLAVLGPEITRAAALPPEAVGLIGGLVNAGAVWFFASSGAVIGPLGPVRALAVACVLSAMAACIMLSGWAVAILLAAPLVGFAYAATAPAGSEILSRATPKRLWSTLFSIRMAGVPAGGAVAGLVAAGLATNVSWRAGLLAMALLPLLSALFLILAGGRWRGDGQGWPTFSAVFAARNVATPFAVLRRAPRLRRLTIASLGFAAAQSGVFTFLPTYLTDGLGLSLALAGALFATMHMASFAGRILIGFIADRIGPRRRTLIGLGLLSAAVSVLLTLATATTPMPVLFAGAAMIGVSMATWNGLFLAEIATASPDSDVSAGTSAATFFTFISYMATPPLFAVLVSMGSYEIAYLVTASAVLGSTLYLARAA